MKKTYMRQAYMGMIGDIKNLERHFTLMAEKGWMIDKIGLFTLRYRAVEPCKKRFFVDFLPQITAFDYPENENAQDYRSICEESGWTFVAANKQFHIFCADGENPAPIPIHTDNAIHAKIYLNACRKYELPWFIFALFMLWFSSPLGKGMELFLLNISLFMALGYCFFFIGYLWNLGFMLRWYLRTRKSAKNDLPLPAVNYRLARLRINVFIAGIILFLACMATGVVLEILGGMPAVIIFAMLSPLAGVGVGLWIRRQIDTKRRTRAGNIGLMVAALVILEIIVIGSMIFIAHHIISSPPSFNTDSLGDRPALTLNDVGITAEPRNTFTNVKGTAAVPVDYEYRESIAGGAVSTHVYRSVSKTLSKWLYEYLSDEFNDWFERRILDDAVYVRQGAVTALSPAEAAFWGAEKGVSFNYANSGAVEVLLWNGKTILRITAEGADINLETLCQAVQKLWYDVR